LTLYLQFKINAKIGGINRLTQPKKIHINDLENLTHQLEEKMNAIIYIADKIIINSDSEDNRDPAINSDSLINSDPVDK
jgi:hypothetical protein